MSNKPSWMKTLQKAQRMARTEPPTVDVHIDPDRIRQGHNVTLLPTTDDTFAIACVCGALFSGPRSQKDELERKAFEHVYETD